MSVAVLLTYLSGLVGMSGVVTTAVNFDPENPWYGVGLLAIAVAALAGLGAVLSSHRTRILAAFDIGFQSGYRRGRRKTPLRVVHQRSGGR